MKEDGIDGLKKKLDEMDKHAASLQRHIQYQDRVVQVLVAVGYLSNAKLEQAREIVSSLAD